MFSPVCVTKTYQEPAHIHVKGPLVCHLLYFQHSGVKGNYLKLNMHARCTQLLDTNLRPDNLVVRHPLAEVLRHARRHLGREIRVV
jgi:hypothetical protein